jgi:hypothetical protein
VYLGIVDEGVVKGIRLSQYQVYCMYEAVLMSWDESCHEIVS